jgi:hypothetical protein
MLKVVLVLTGLLALAAVAFGIPAMQAREAKACVERFSQEHMLAKFRSMPARCSSGSNSLGFGNTDPACTAPVPMPAMQASELCLRERQAKR